MSRADEILSAASDAGMHFGLLSDAYCDALDLPRGTRARICAVSFDQIVAVVERMVAAEREACAAIAQRHKREHYRIGSAISAAIRARGAAPSAPPPELQMVSPTACWCQSCDVAANGLRSRMSLCPECGNKRCPRAEHHSGICTGSNALGQGGGL